MTFEQLRDKIAKLPKGNLPPFPPSRAPRYSVFGRKRKGEYPSQILTLKLVTKVEEIPHYTIQVTSSGISKGLRLTPELIPPFDQNTALSFTIYLLGCTHWSEWCFLDLDLVEPLYRKLQSIRYALNHPEKVEPIKAPETVRYNPAHVVSPRKARYSLDKYDNSPTS